MDLKITYKTKGVCSSAIDIEVEDGFIKDVSFSGGCDGNLQAISRLATGMSAENVVRLFEGIKCGRKNTSCPDQFAKALMSIDNDK